MTIEAGMVFEGKVTGITDFGAFVSLPERQSGLVHISEVANTYVSDVNQFLKMGQIVKVLVVSITPQGKFNLSIKKAEDLKPLNSLTASESPRPRMAQRDDYSPQRVREDAYSAPKGQREASNAGDSPAPQSNSEDFEERLKRFMKQSDSRVAENPLYAEHRQRRPRR